MNPSGAAEHLQTIRTLMERSAVYRRALAPVMLAAGMIGIVACAASSLLHVGSTPGFILYWSAIAVATLTVNLFQVRQQALKSAEQFWSSPTRRVAEAVRPGFAAGAFAALWFYWYGKPEQIWALPGIWAMACGCGLHAAGYSMLRSIRRFGMVLLGLGALQLLVFGGTTAWQTPFHAHVSMGMLFGAMPLALGIWLHFTESKEGSV